MIFGLEGLVGKNTKPASRISSALVSLIILFLIYQNVVPEQYNYILFVFLGWHLSNQLLASLTESHKYACHKCGKPLKIISYNFEKHTCSKKKPSKDERRKS